MMNWACGTRMCASSVSALWTLCVSLRRILLVVHYYSFQQEDLFPGLCSSVFYGNSVPSHFYPTFKNRKDPDTGLLLLLGGYVRASYHGVSQQQKIHIATARSCGLWPINCYDYATTLSCFCVSL